jgi:hypothetical protein
MSNLQEHLAALTPARDRRLQTRTTPASLTYVELGDTNGGLVLNISETGMAVAVAEPPEVGEYLPRIRFPLPSSRQSIEISAQIVWLAESKKGAGLRFVDLTAHARHQVSNWIASQTQASEFEESPNPLPRDKQTLELRSHKSRWIFSNPSVRDEEVAARYAEMFPSESTYAKHSTTVEETKPQRATLPISACTDTGADVSMCGSDAEISNGDVPQSLATIFPSEHAKDLAAEPIKTSIPELTPEAVERLIPATLENIPTEPNGSFSLERVQIPSPELVARTEREVSEILAPEILAASAPLPVNVFKERVHQPISAVPGFELQVPKGKVESSPDQIDGSPSDHHVPEASAIRGFGFQLAALVSLFALIGFGVALTVEGGPLGKLLRHAQKSMLAIDATPPKPPNPPGEMTSRTSAPPAGFTIKTPAVNPPAPKTEESRSEGPSAPSINARPADSVTRTRPTGPSSAVTSRSNIDSDNSSGVNKRDDARPSEEKSKESTRNSESRVNVPSSDLNSSPTTESNPSANLETSPERHGSKGPIGRNASPPVSPEHAHSPVTVGPGSAAPKDPAPRDVTPPTGRVRYQSPRSGILVTAPAEGKPTRLVFPEKLIAVSSSFAITSQLSVLVFPEPGPAVAHQPARLQAGELISYVEPRYPRRERRYGMTETVKVHATIGQSGQVMDVTPVSGPVSLFPTAISAVHVWRYKPTLLNDRPVQAQQDVTIEFRPPVHDNKAPGKAIIQGLCKVFHFKC